MNEEPKNMLPSSVICNLNACLSLIADNDGEYVASPKVLAVLKQQQEFMRRYYDWLFALFEAESHRLVNRDESMAMVIGDIVIDRAREMFEVMGYADDFCVQSVGSVCVFGGSNRLVYSVVSGFAPALSYCSQQFAEAFNQHYGKL